MNFRLDNSTNRHARSCVNCAHVALAGEVHECPAFLTHAEVVEQARDERLRTSLGGFCHCTGFFRGSDHCQCCGCEEYESTCLHVCDGVTCVTTHDERGRID